MEKVEMVERAKAYLQLLTTGVNPITGGRLSSTDVACNDRVKACLTFVNQILGEYLVLSDKIAELEEKAEQNEAADKKDFYITKEQCDRIKLSQKPITLLTLAKNINLAVGDKTMKRLRSVSINNWLIDKGYVTKTKTKTLVNKTVYAPTADAFGLGMVAEENLDEETGEIKTQLKLNPSAQLFIIEHLREIIDFGKPDAEE